MDSGVGDSTRGPHYLQYLILVEVVVRVVQCRIRLLKILLAFNYGKSLFYQSTPVTETTKVKMINGKDCASWSIL